MNISNVLWLCESGDSVLLEILLPLRRFDSPKYMEAAARGGQIVTLMFLLRKNYRLGGGAIREARRNGNLDVVKHLHTYLNAIAIHDLKVSVDRNYLEIINGKGNNQPFKLLYNFKIYKQRLKYLSIESYFLN